MTKQHILYIVTVLFVLTQTLPPINLLSPLNPSVHFALFDAIVIFLFPDLLTRRSFLALFAYTFFAFIFHLLGNAFFDTTATVFVPFLMMLSGLLIVEYALKYDHSYFLTRMVVFTVVASNLIMIFISIPQVKEIPDIIRPSSQEFEFGVRENYWLISYSTCHGLSYLFAPLIFLCRRSFRKSMYYFLFWVFVSVAFFYIIFLSNATLPLLISFLMIGLGLLYNAEQLTLKNIRSIVVIGILSFVLFQSSVSISVIETLQDVMVVNSSNYRKMDEIKYAILYDETEGDMNVRQDLYYTSAELFVQSPIIGTKTPELISHHTWFIDRLACFGVLFFIPIVLLFIFHIKDTYSQLRHTKVVYFIGVLGFLLMLLLKNEFGAGSWLYGFAFLPLLCRYIDYLIDEKLNN